MPVILNAYSLRMDFLAPFKTVIQRYRHIELTERQFLAVTVLLIGIVFNKPLISFIAHIPGNHNLSDWVFKASLLSLLFSILWIAALPFYILRVTKWGALFLFFTASATSYFMDSYGVIFDESVLQSFFETSSAEAYQYLNFWHVIHIIFISFGVTLFFAFLPLKTEDFKQRSTFVLMSLLNITLILSTSAGLFYKDYASLFRNNRKIRHMINPISPIYQTAKVLQLIYFPKHHKFHDQTPGLHHTSVPRKRIFVMILGETVRADHLTLNGYEKNTTPLLAKQDLINFSQVQSCGTSTAVSVPCLFSSLGRKDFEQVAAEDQSNLLDIVQAAGYKTTWIDNNTGCKGVCERIPSLSPADIKTPEFCPTSTCYDEVLLSEFKKVIQKSGEDQFIILHMLGSHGPSYYQRYPMKFAKFTPECLTSNLSDCSQEQVVNTYDNTILYTDYVVNGIIEHLKTWQKIFDVGLMYVSDHGESLGENGIYLHSLPYVLAPKAQTHVPLFLWLSPEFIQHTYKSRAQLTDKANCPLSHDNIFHTLLSALKIETEHYKADLDISRLNSRPCKATQLITEDQ